jgi:hypothetical protein
MDDMLVWIVNQYSFMNVLIHTKYNPAIYPKLHLIADIC